MSIMGIINIIVVAIISAVVGGLVKKVLNLMEKQRQLAEEQARKEKLRAEEQEAKEGVYRRALHQMLEYTIAHIRRSAIEEGCVTTYQLKDAIDLHETYKELGGNGFLDKLMDEVKNLPSADVDEHELYRKKAELRASAEKEQGK